MEAHGSKKRKMADEENDEDDKVEEFFALIRSTREVRDRLRSNDHGHHRQDKAVDVSRKESSVWNPTFRPEDFLDDRDHRDDNDKNKPSCHGGTSHRQSPPPPPPPPPIPPRTEVENLKLVEVGKVSGSNEETNNNNDNSLELDLKLSL